MQILNNIRTWGFTDGIELNNHLDCGVMLAAEQAPALAGTGGIY